MILPHLSKDTDHSRYSTRRSRALNNPLSGEINPLSGDAVKLIVRRDAKRLIVRCSWRGGFQPVLVSDVTSTGRRSDQYWLILLTRTTSISDQYWSLFRSLEGVLIACMCALLLPALQMEMPRGDTQTIASRAGD